MLSWCNYKIDIIEVDVRDIETFTRIEPDVAELCSWGGAKVLKKTFGERNLQVVVKSCRCRKIRSISEVIERNSCLDLQPNVYLEGWEEHRVIGFRDSDYKKLFQDLAELGPVEVLEKATIKEPSIKESYLIPLKSVLSELTDKQANSLLTALDYGYYYMPKKMTAEEIATKTKIPRTTYEEHLRKAESKIMRALAPYVRMYASREPEKLEPLPQVSNK